MPPITDVQPGMIFDAPGRGERIKWLTTIDKTGGAYVEFEHTTFPPAYFITTHIHNKQTETYEVVSGSAWYEIDGKRYTLEEGETVVIPPYTPHVNPINADDRPLTVRRVVEPDYGVQAFYTTWFSLAAVNMRLTPNYELDYMQLAVISQTMPGKTYFAQFPGSLQELAIALAAPIGKLFGYKPYYPELDFPISKDPSKPVPNARNEQDKPLVP